MLSAAVHLGLLLILLVHFSQDQKFDDATEAVPVDTITESQFREIMQGEKTAPKAAKARVDKVADKAETAPPQTKAPPKPEVPTPPPPLQRQNDPGEDDHKSTPAPAAPTPPPRPTPPVEKPPVPTPPQRPAAPQDQPDEPDDAEVVKPKPPPEKPVPKPPEKPVEKPPEKPVPKPPEKPPEKPVEKPSPKARLDEVAKLLGESKDKAAEKSSEAPAKPKSGSAQAPSRPGADLNAISKLVASQAPDAKFATGREISRPSAQGAAHASGARMSPSLSDALNSLLQEQYKACWSYLPLTGGGKYVPKIKVAYQPDGSLAGQPTLLNPPSDPAFRGLAESALRAVRRCNPLRIPAQYQPYYDQWKDWVVGFDPEILN